MSATLTMKRKSARDRPRQVMRVGIGGGGRGGHRRLDRGTSGHEPARFRLRLTPQRGSAVFSSHACSDRSAPICVLPLPLTHRALSPSSRHRLGRAAAAAHAVADPPLSAALSQRPAQAPPLPHSWHVAGTCVARAHACVRTEICVHVHLPSRQDTRHTTTKGRPP